MKSLNINHKKYRRGFIMVLLVSCLGCEDFLQIDPPKTEIITEKVFEDEASAIAAIRGIYSLMITNSSFTNAEMERYTGLSADEFINYSTQLDQQQFALPSLSVDNQIILNFFWKEAYLYILNANTVLEGIQLATGLSANLKMQLEGEAKFIRAYSHLQLMSLFGDIPYITTTDYRQSGTLPRQLTDEVYTHIIEDLKDAQNLLPEDYAHANNQRIQPNRFAATALLARVFLYKKDYVNAEIEATKVLDNTTYSLTELNKVFLANSQEAIWQLQPVIPGTNTRQAILFYLSRKPASSVGRVALNPEMLDVFENLDLRKTEWIGEYIDGTTTYYFPTKYKVVGEEVQSEYSTVLRLAEQYLIRAEARANLNKETLAIQDLDVIRMRAGLPLLADTNPTITQPELLLAIEQEREVELFTEGHRWIDLIRTERATTILGPGKVDWQPTDQKYPIPQNERSLNPALTQNPGY